MSEAEQFALAKKQYAEQLKQELMGKKPAKAKPQPTEEQEATHSSPSEQQKTSENAFQTPSTVVKLD